MYGRLGALCVLCRVFYKLIAENEGKVQRYTVHRVIKGRKRCRGRGRGDMSKVEIREGEKVESLRYDMLCHAVEISHQTKEEFTPCSNVQL